MRSENPALAARMPAQVDDLLAEVDTPALVIDLDLFEGNLAAMAEAVGGNGVRLRPHAKSHKCPEIAKRQIAHGAIGICCQKVGEAEAFVAAGISDVLVTNEIVGGHKLARLAALARSASIGVLVDDPGNVAKLAAAATHARSTLEVLVEMSAPIAAESPRAGARSSLRAPSRHRPGRGCASAACTHIRARHSICAGPPSAARPSRVLSNVRATPRY